MSAFVRGRKLAEKFPRRENPYSLIAFHGQQVFIA